MSALCMLGERAVLRAVLYFMRAAVWLGYSL